MVPALLPSPTPAPEPDGLDRSRALPFVWYKPPELYAPAIDMPNAIPPITLERNDGPTWVGYRFRRNTVQELLGVSDWPAVGRTFQFIPYGERVTPEQTRFNRLLRSVGFDRSGFDAEHVWDVYLRGLSFDRFSNLWPASNQEQQLAGPLHRNQIEAHRVRLGNVNGRWFRIVRVSHPAVP